jgi:hypothetical protein
MKNKNFFQWESAGSMSATLELVPQEAGLHRVALSINERVSDDCVLASHWFHCRRSLLKVVLGRSPLTNVMDPKCSREQLAATARAMHVDIEALGKPAIGLNDQRLEKVQKTCSFLRFLRFFFTFFFIGISFPLSFFSSFSSFLSLPSPFLSFLFFFFLGG